MLPHFDVRIEENAACHAQSMMNKKADKTQRLILIIVTLRQMTYTRR
jgi:hypothetical protein